MDGNRSSISSFKNIIGLQNPFSNKTTFGWTNKPPKIVRFSPIRGYESRNTKNVKQRRDPSKRAPNRVFLDYVSKGKVRWNKQANLQPKEIKPLRPRSEIQTVKPLPDTFSSQSKRLYGKNRHIAGLLSCTNNTNTSQIPVSSIRGTDLRNDVSAIRSVKCTTRFFESDKLVSTLVQTNSKREDGSLPGRFSRSTPGPKSSRETSKVRGSKTRRLRVGSKQIKVPTRTFTMPRILRHSLEHARKPKDAFRNKNHTDQIIDPKIYRDKTMELVRCKNITRKTELCNVYRSSRETPLSLVTDRGQQTAKIKTPHALAYDRHGTDRTGMVDRKCKQQHSYTSAQPISVHHDRRRRLGLGCDSERPETMGKLGRIAKTLALQPKRTLGTLRSHKDDRPPPEGQNNNLANRQPNCSCLHNKTGRHKVKKTIKNHNEYPAPVQSISLHHYGSLYPRTIQRLGRQPLQDEKSTRMASESSDNSRNFSKFGDSRNRPVCIEALCDCAELCIRGCCRCEKSVHRCVQPAMATHSRVDLSPSCSDSKSTSSPAALDRGLFTSNSGVAQSILDVRNKKSSNSTTLENSQSPLPSRGLADEQATARSRQPQFAGLDSTGWANELLDWNNDEIELLQDSWRSSTLKTYRPAWLRWCKWASENSVKTEDPGPADLARYLCHLYNIAKLAPNTILLHKSVVATFTNPHKSSYLSSHPIIGHTIKGILSKKAKRKAPLSWKVEDLIKFLESYNFDGKSLFAVSRHTCILLLLASGRRVHDLTLLSINPDHFEEKDEELILWPKYGSKTDNSSYRQSGWSFKAMLTERFNIVYWIKQVISLSQERRGSRELESLFITTRGAVKPASRAVIAGWIKTLFKEAHISSSAGSIRAGVATDNWTQKNMNIDEVLKRGNWRSKNTFFNHYFREVQSSTSTTTSNNINLTTCFSPVD